MIVCGIWAALCLSFYRHFFPVEPGWWAYAGAYIPPAALWVWYALTEPPDA